MKLTHRTLLIALATSASFGLPLGAIAQEVPGQAAPTQAPAEPAVTTADVPASTTAPAPAEAQPAPAAAESQAQPQPDAQPAPDTGKKKKHKK